MAEVTFRASGSQPCPVCGAGSKSCSATDDDLHFCRGEPHDGWSFVKDCGNGFKAYRRTRIEEVRNSAPVGPRPATDQQIQMLADALRLEPAALAPFAIGWNGSAHTWAEVDAKGATTGFMRRFPDGEKKMTYRQHRGLVVPRGWRDRLGPVYCVEGFSDTAAMTYAGLPCIGRSNDLAGADLLAELLRDWPADREIVIVGENDSREKDGRTIWPGKAGAEKTASKVCQLLRRRILVAMPPDGAKDARDFFTSPAMAGLPWSERGERFARHLLDTATARGAEPPPGDVDRGDVVDDSADRPLNPLSDMGNAHAFVNHHAENLRYVEDWKCFVEFDGTRWSKDEHGHRTFELAKSTANAMLRDAQERFAIALDRKATLEAEPPSGDAQQAKAHEKIIDSSISSAKAVVSWCQKLFNAKFLNNMIRVAQSDPRLFVAVGDEVFDRNPHLFNCANGTLDLRTGQLRSHDRKDFITSICPTRYNPTAPAERYLRFLDQIFSNSPELVAYVRRLSGYALTGLVKDQAAYFFTGDGSNGKSVLLDLWPAVMGDSYCYQAPATVLMEGAKDRHPTELVGFCGARLAVVNETQEEGALNEARLKMLTGGDEIAARGMRENFFKFRPSHKLILASNHKPRIRGIDHGVWRRPRVVEFRRQFWRPQDQLRDPNRVFRPEDRADADLPDVLRTEAEGVLADMVRHAAEFFKPPFRFEPPAEVTRATESYREEEDKAGQFLKTRTVPHDSDTPIVWMTGKELRKLYDDWSEENGFTALEKISSRKLGQCAKRLYRWKKTSGVIRYQCKESDHHLAKDELGEDQEREGQPDLGRHFPVNPYYERPSSSNPEPSSLPPSDGDHSISPDRRRAEPNCRRDPDGGVA